MLKKCSLAPKKPWLILSRFPPPVPPSFTSHASQVPAHRRIDSPSGGSISLEHMSVAAAGARAVRLGAPVVPRRHEWLAKKQSAVHRGQTGCDHRRSVVTVAASRGAPQSRADPTPVGDSNDFHSKSRALSTTSRARDVAASASAARSANGAASHQAGSDTDTVFPLESAGAGWDAVQLHALTGLAWSFTTPSSTDGRKIVKAAGVVTNVSFKGSSNWRKEDWESAAQSADVSFSDDFSTLPGMRGFRACWAQHGVALLYVPGVRRFYTMADVSSVRLIDEKAEKPTGGVTAALVALCRVKQGFAKQYQIAIDDNKQEESSKLARVAFQERLVSQRAAARRNAIENGGTGVDDEVNGNGDAENDDAAGSDKTLTTPTPSKETASVQKKTQNPPPTPYLTPRTCVARWCVGLGVDAAALHLEYGIGFDFHGPAGSVTRSVVVAAAKDAGSPMTDVEFETWNKHEWVDSSVKFGVNASAAHANVNALGRSWKVCWVAEAVEKGIPAVFLWVPERNAYYTLGSLAAAGASGAQGAGNTTGVSSTSAGDENADTPAPPCLVESAIRAVVGVAKSTPAPVGLKHALTRDCDFLTLLGRKPKDANAPVSVGTTGGADAARAADISHRVAAAPRAEPERVSQFLQTESATESETDDDDDAQGDDGDDTQETYERQETAGTPSSTSVVEPSFDEDDSDGTDDRSFFRPAPELGDFEWADSREGLRRRPSRDDHEFDPQRDLVNPSSYVDEPMTVPGFEDVPGMEGFVAADDVTGQGEFFSRSAGYLSFVDGSWSKEDLAREMGLDRQSINDPPVTARDFPDLSQATGARRAGGADVDVADDSLEDDFKELVPPGLPKPFDSYHPLRLWGCDYLVTMTNDGRLDLRDVMCAFRKTDGNFVGEATRVDTTAALQIPPGFYHEVAWTERELKKEEKHNRDGGPTEYNTLVERSTKVFLISADTPFNDTTAYDRRLNFTRPVVVLSNDGSCEVIQTIRGAKENPTGVLVIRDGDLFVEQAETLPNWEHVCHEWEVEQVTQQKQGNGPALHEDFLKDNEDDYVPDDTPEIDTY
tara:strand:+ start:2893 stop:6072 length:3180 start_codon:yes stop_codon:yes gene_type:complete